MNPRWWDTFQRRYKQKIVKGNVKLIYDSSDLRLPAGRQDLRLNFRFRILEFPLETKSHQRLPGCFWPGARNSRS